MPSLTSLNELEFIMINISIDKLNHHAYTNCVDTTPSKISNFGETILELQRKKKALIEEKAAIERQMQVIERTVESLVFLGDPSEKMPLPYQLNEMGLQDAVRTIFRRAFPVPMLPTEVRDTLVSAGTYSPSYKNLLVAVHTAIKRIKDNLEEVPQPEGRMAYRWKMGEVQAPDIGFVTGENFE
jgi:hypothetical protein